MSDKFIEVRNEIFKVAMPEEQWVERTEFSEIDDHGNPVTGKVSWGMRLASPMSRRKHTIFFTTAIKDRKLEFPNTFTDSTKTVYPFTESSLAKVMNVKGAVDRKKTPNATLCYDRTDSNVRYNDYVNNLYNTN